VSDTPVASPSVGDLWWDTEEGQLFIYYTDPDGGSFWMPCSPTVSSAGGGAYVNTSAPPTASLGDLWFNTTNDSLNVYNGSAWESALNEVAGVNALTGTAPVTVDNAVASNPVVGISAATSATQGSVRLATQAEVNATTETSAVITPATLNAGISNYLPGATEVGAGVIELATQSEVDTGVDPLKAVTPATLSAAAPSLGLAIPAGTVVAFAGSSAPAGWLMCDGTSVASATYVDLYAAIGTTYGGNATNFALPDLRGEFIRGLDNSRGVDSGRALGSFQDHEVEAHTHTGTSGDSGTDPTKEGGGRRDSDDGTYTTDSYGGGETRPRNVAMNYIIKT
jgi:microcystin-dependent protein